MEVVISLHPLLNSDISPFAISFYSDLLKKGIFYCLGVIVISNILIVDNKLVDILTLWKSETLLLKLLEYTFSLPKYIYGGIHLLMKLVPPYKNTNGGNFFFDFIFLKFFFLKKM